MLDPIAATPNYGQTNWKTLANAKYFTNVRSCSSRLDLVWSPKGEFLTESLKLLGLEMVISIKNKSQTALIPQRPVLDQTNYTF